MYDGLNLEGITNSAKVWAHLLVHSFDEEVQQLQTLNDFLLVNFHLELGHHLQTLQKEGRNIKLKRR